MKVIAALLMLTVLPMLAWGEAQQFCIYMNESGTVQQVDSLDKVPEGQRAAAKCFSPKEHTFLAKPEEVELEGNLRRESMASALGQVELRWPRKVEQLFGHTPKKAVLDAVETVSRALKQSGFPQEVRTMDQPWSIVFMDADLPETQIPSYLVSNCHPAWMTPPSNIYVVSQRVVSGCGGGQSVTKSVADAQLSQILVHEIGHAIEAALIPQTFAGDRMRGEGFATWFESYACDYSRLIPKGSVLRAQMQMARSSLRRNPDLSTFSGSAEDYVRASLFFHAIVAKKGVRGLMDLYQAMNEKQIPFIQAIASDLGWSQKKLAEEIAKVVG